MDGACFSRKDGAPQSASGAWTAAVRHWRPTHSLPLLLVRSRALLSPLESWRILGPASALLVAGLLLNLLAFALAAELLFALGRHVWLSPADVKETEEGFRTVDAGSDANADLPLLAAYFFCISPAGIFFSALYTES